MSNIRTGEPQTERLTRRIFSALALGALALGAFVSVASATAVYADTATSTASTTTALALSKVGIIPSTESIHAGQSADVYFTEASGQADLAVTGSCTVNGVDVASTFQNLTDGLYKVVYTVGSSDPEVAAGQVPLNCTLGDSSGTVTASAWNDGNTLAIDTNNDGTISNTSSSNATSTATSTDSGSSGSTQNNSGSDPVITAVGLVPSTGTTTAGRSMDVYFTAANNESDIVIGGSCTVNGVDVASTFQNLTDGLYKVVYTVGSSDPEVAAGDLPVNCVLANTIGTTAVTAFTDHNSTAIDVNNDGTITTSGSSGSGSNGNTSTTTGSMSGDVSGGSTDAPLSLDSITQVSSTATAGGGFAGGWAWDFHLTVPNAETKLSLKFGDWLNSDGTHTIPVAGNMRISSVQASSADPVTLTAADSYSAPLTLVGDEDPNTPGRQVEVKVEVQVPSTAANGTYSTSYGVQSQQP